jgi:VanZ family protein
MWRSALRRSLEPHYAWLAAGIAIVILYGSFYPFAFYNHRDPRGPLGVLFDVHHQPISRDDVVANILLYMPLGFFVFCALQQSLALAVTAATAAGFALSTFVEVMQYYDHTRVQAVSDIGADTLGALLGAFGGIAARRRVRSAYLALLLFCWIGSRWFPARVVQAATPLEVFRFFAAWLSVALMLETLCGNSRSRMLFPLFVGVSLLVRACIVDVEPAEAAGSLAAVALWSGILWKLSGRAIVAAALSVALIVLLALVPFHFLATPRAFGWLPFRSFFESPTQTAIRVFFEKSFSYGGMVWLLVRAGLSSGAAAIFGGSVVFSLRVLQVYLPGRSAEVTDALLLLMLAAMMKLIALAEQPAKLA